MASLLRRLSQRSRASADSQHTSSSAPPASTAAAACEDSFEASARPWAIHRFSLQAFATRTRASLSIYRTPSSLNAEDRAGGLLSESSEQAIVARRRSRRHASADHDHQRLKAYSGHNPSTSSLWVFPRRTPGLSPSHGFEHPPRRSAIAQVKDRLLALTTRRTDTSRFSASKTERCNLLDDDRSDTSNGHLPTVKELLADGHGAEQNPLRRVQPLCSPHPRHRSLDQARRMPSEQNHRRHQSRNSDPGSILTATSCDVVQGSPDEASPTNRHLIESPESEISLYEYFGSRPLKLKPDGLLRLEYGIGRAGIEDDSWTNRPGHSRFRTRRASMSEVNGACLLQQRDDAAASLSRDRWDCFLDQSYDNTPIKGVKEIERTQESEDRSCSPTKQWQTGAPPCVRPPPLFMSDVWTRERLLTRNSQGGGRTNTPPYSGFPTWRNHLSRGSQEQQGPAAQPQLFKSKSGRRHLAVDGFPVWSAGLHDHPLMATQLALPPRSAIPDSSEDVAESARPTSRSRPRSAYFLSTRRGQLGRSLGGTEARRTASAPGSELLSRTQTMPVASPGREPPVPDLSPTSASKHSVARSRAVTDPILAKKTLSLAVVRDQEEPREPATSYGSAPSSLLPARATAGRLHSHRKTLTLDLDISSSPRNKSPSTSTAALSRRSSLLPSMNSTIATTSNNSNKKPVLIVVTRSSNRASIHC